MGTSAEFGWGTLSGVRMGDSSAEFDAEVLDDALAELGLERVDVLVGEGLVV